MGISCTKYDKMSEIKYDTESLYSRSDLQSAKVLPGASPQDVARIEELFVAKRYLHHVMRQGISRHEYLVEMMQLVDKRNAEVAEAGRVFRDEKVKRAAAARALERVETEILESRQYLTKLRADVQELFQYLRERRVLQKELMEENAQLHEHLNRRKKGGSKLRDTELVLNTEIAKWERKLKLSRGPYLSDSEDELAAAEARPPSHLSQLSEVMPRLSQISRTLSQPLTVAQDLTAHSSIQEWLVSGYQGSVEAMVKDLDNYDQCLANAINKATVYTEEINQMVEEVLEEVENVQTELLSLWERTQAAEEGRVQAEAELKSLQIERDCTRDSVQIVKAEKSKLLEVIREVDDSLANLGSINKQLRSKLPPLSRAPCPSTPSLCPPCPSTPSLCPPCSYSDSGSSGSSCCSSPQSARLDGELFTLPRI